MNPDRPLEDWPELITAFVEDLGRCQSHAAAVALLEGLSHGNKALIFSGCPPALQRRLWALKQEAIAA